MACRCPTSPSCGLWTGRTCPTFGETAHYNKVASAHNIAINEDSGYAYVVGASGKNSCSGGLHMVDIRTPTSPAFGGCFGADGYTHDTQCVIYAGPDGDHTGREICVNSNEDTVSIVDVTDEATRRCWFGAAMRAWATPIRGG